MHAAVSPHKLQKLKQNNFILEAKGPKCRRSVSKATLLLEALWENNFLPCPASDGYQILACGHITANSVSIFIFPHPLLFVKSSLHVCDKYAYLYI